jgi:Spy/CpxP family protein refolding chaperone
VRTFALALVATCLPLLSAAQGAAPLPPPPPPPPPPAKPALEKPVDPAKHLRADLRQKKTELIAKNLTLTPDQAAAFWPIYKRYDDEVAKLQEETVALVNEYLAVYDRLDDAKARDLQDRQFAIAEKAIQLRRACAGEVGKVLPGKLTAKFVQLDRYFSLLAEVQVQSRIPQIP